MKKNINKTVRNRRILFFRTIIILSVILFLNSCSNANQLSGYWVGTMEMNGKTVDFSLDLNDSTISSNDIMFQKQRIQNLSFKNGILKFSYTTYDVNISYEGILDDNNIKGNLKIQEMPPEIAMSFNLSKQSDTSPTKNYSIEKLIIASNGANISAEIYKPKTRIPHPAIVLLHGSFSDNPKSEFAFYADFFVKQGIEVLIFDKRGSGESTGNSVTATYENLAEDAIACLKVLNQRESIDKSKIGLWGISQGGMLLPFIASKTEIPSFLIAVSPDINGASEAAAFSDSLRVVNNGYTPEEGQIVAESHRKVAEMIRVGSDYSEVLLFINETAQKYRFMNETGLHDRVIIDKETFDGLYWSGRKYNFYNYWKNLKILTLVLFGSDDRYVDASKNKILLDKLNNEIEIKLFPGANHILKKTVNPNNYSDFDFPRITDGYLEFVSKWIVEKLHNEH